MNAELAKPNPEMTIEQLRELTQKAQNAIADVLNAVMRETGFVASCVTYQTDKDKATGRTQASNVKITMQT